MIKKDQMTARLISLATKLIISNVQSVSYYATAYDRDDYIHKGKKLL